MIRNRGARIRVTTLATLTHSAWAECNGCDWERHAEDEASWPAVREAARRHAAHRGHTVTAGYRVMRDYGVTATAPA